MLKCDLQISRPHPDGNYIQITLMDEASSTQFMTLAVSCAEFAKALTGLNVEAEFDLHAGHVGQRLEWCDQEVLIPDREKIGDERERIATEAVTAAASALGSEWAGDVKDASNHHNFVRSEDGGHVYRVRFHRYVA